MSDDRSSIAPASDCRQASNELSIRDLQILTALSVGETRKEIARELYMSQANVAYRIRVMSSQLHVHGTTALIAMAVHLGILSADDWPLRPARTAQYDGCPDRRPAHLARAPLDAGERAELGFGGDESADIATGRTLVGAEVPNLCAPAGTELSHKAVKLVTRPGTGDA